MADFMPPSEIDHLLRRLPGYIPDDITPAESAEVISGLIRLVGALANGILVHEEMFLDFVGRSDLAETDEQVTVLSSYTETLISDVASLRSDVQIALDVFGGDFAKLQGPVGPRGDPGPRGEKGTNGTNGIDAVLDPSPLYTEQEEKMKDMQGQIDELTSLVKFLMEDEDE